MKSTLVSHTYKVVSRSNLSQGYFIEIQAQLQVGTDLSYRLGGRFLEPRPKISVCIPTYKRPELFREAFNSVISSTLQDFEIVVSDDNGYQSDEIREIVDEYKDKRVRYFRHNPSGMHANWTFCMRQAQAPLIFKLDDDDLIEPTFLEEAVNFMDEHEDCMLVFPAHKVVYSDGRPEKQVFDDNFFGKRTLVDGHEFALALLLNRSHPRNHKSAGVCRKEPAAKMKYFENLQDDVFFTLGLASQGKVGYIREILFIYRLFSGQPSEGASLRPVERSINGIQAFFKLPWVRRDLRYSSIKEPAIRRMLFIVPLMYVRSDMSHNGRVKSFRNARKLLTEHEVLNPALLWPAIFAAACVPEAVYRRALAFYSSRGWPKRFLNAIVK